MKKKLKNFLANHPSSNNDSKGNLLKSKDLFLSAIQTLLFSWGGDAPAEAVWTFNELVDWLNEEENLNLSHLNEDLSNYSIIEEELKLFEMS
jgi:hypothetical protein